MCSKNSSKDHSVQKQIVGSHIFQNLCTRRQNRDSLDKLTISECFATLKTFQKNNKTPGIDGLTIEFHLKNVSCTV